MPFYERQPYIQALHQIVKEVMRGDIRVPRFQRPGTQEIWRPEQRGNLLDSLYHGFPVGTILLWNTPTPIPTHTTVGGFRIPPLQDNRGPQRLLLDGHQRLSTLVQILGPGLLTELQEEKTTVTRVESDDPDRAELKERWVFELDTVATTNEGRQRFTLLRPGQEPAKTQVPLEIVLHRSALNRWVRETKLTDKQETMVDSLRDKLREYAMPVAVLATESLEEATECFKRINSSGTPMSDFHMVAALAFSEENDLQQQFAEARAQYLEPIGWAGVSDTDVLRVAAGLDVVRVAGGLDRNRNPLELEVADLAQSIRKDRGLIERAFQAVAAASKLLEICGVHRPASLPYIWQLITLAVHLGRASTPGAPAPFGAASLSAAQRWFWITTYGEVFGGVNSAVVDRSLLALQEMLGGGGWSKMGRDVTRLVRPVESFDFRRARSKACALAMARYQDDGRRDGPAHRALALGVDAMQLLFSRGRRSRWWDLAVVTPEHGVSELREALKRRASGVDQPGDYELLSMLGIMDADHGSLEDLLVARRERLEAAERDFVQRDLGLTWG